MSEPLSVVTAFVLGLLGSAHCMGMCGGIAATIGLRQHQKRIDHLLGYNFGRVISYSIAGALVGSLGFLLKGEILGLALRTFAGLLLIAMGLYIAKWWQGLLQVEKLGGYAWHFIQPFAARLLPVESAKQAITLGFFWGWLPCGLVYSTLLWSATAQSASQSALLMLAFGVGTLPAMLLTGILAQQAQSLLANQYVRSISGLMVIVFGIYTIPFAGLQALL
ncbi:sulfite exporter TauE/SafE family protein [Neptunomonas marina]|uniref:Sulfite exporter TauE/SafE family protein n=1 Tax=Neptunomonas marina TaxID=1815562 RepID=A0A437Q7T8_9GAMM|nr:sulfite exporter TauE/SafE family protein [Neptunomonas marina]RVU30605.1 sulfite exporter TauE/SafE family protein [Neptunomonas marina]